MEYDSAIERNKLLVYAITRMNLKNVVLNETGQTQKITYHMI